MRRVVVTGLGAITPVGNTAPETWRAAVAGKSGIGWINAFDPGDSPGESRSRGQGLRPGRARVAEKEVRRLDRNVLLALGAVKEAVSDANLNGFDPMRVGIVFGSAIGGFIGITEQQQVLR